MGLPEVSDRSILRDFCKQQMEMDNKYADRQHYHKNANHIKRNHSTLAISAPVIKQYVKKGICFYQCKGELSKLFQYQQKYEIYRPPLLTKSFLILQTKYFKCFCQYFSIRPTAI
jgi:hypothetical protein